MADFAFDLRNLTVRPLNLTLIGAGEYWRQYISRIASELEMDGFAKVQAAVDTRGSGEIELKPGVGHILRTYPNEPLSDLIAPTQPDVVIIANPNRFHVDDAEELVNKGFRVLMEKPYASDEREVSRVAALLTNTNRLALSEYYLHEKTAALQILIGSVPTSSFYFEKPGMLTGNVDALREHAGKFRAIVGQITSIDTILFEGEGKTGSFLHRNDDLSIAPWGGVIHDIGIHALAPIIGLTGSLRVQPESLNVAVCDEHQRHFLESHSRENVSETYAEVDFVSSEGFPVSFKVGKYVLGWQLNPAGGRNERVITINGTNGKVVMDTSNRVMQVFSGHNQTPAWEVQSNVNLKYYGTIRTAIEDLIYGENRLSRTALEGQKAVLAVVKEAQPRYSAMPCYSGGAEIREIRQLFRR